MVPASTYYPLRLAPERLFYRRDAGPARERLGAVDHATPAIILSSASVPPAYLPIVYQHARQHARRTAPPSAGRLIFPRLHQSAWDQRAAPPGYRWLSGCYLCRVAG